MGSTRFLLAWLLLTAPLHGAASTVGADLDDDARTGLAEFALAAGDLPRALHFTRHTGGEKAEFIRARILAEIGDRESARELLKGISGNHSQAADAALILGRMAMEEGDSEAAEKHLAAAARSGQGDVKQQALFLSAELKRRAGRLEAAGATLANMEEGYWAALGYMNVASDYARHDINAARALISLRVALAMTSGDSDADRIRELRSRILLRAGYLAYRQGDHSKAAGFLEKVPMETFSTPQALYYHGLAQSATGNYRGAMQSWHRAKKYPLAYPGVAGAWLGMGRGYDQAGYLGQAGEAFLAANSTYDKERVTLRKLADEVNDKGAYEAFVRASGNEGVEWFLAENRTLTQPRQAYLLHFVETPGGQRRVRQMASLEAMEVRLEARENDLKVFRSALRERMRETRGNEVGSGLPQVGEDLQRMKQRLSRISTGSASPAQRARLADAQRRLDALLDRQARLGRGVTARNGYFAGLLEQTEQSLDQLLSLRGRLKKIQSETSQKLDEEVRAFITSEDRRIAFNQDRAEQQIAHLYEFLAMEDLEKGAP